ncbi:MAG: protein-L-isoaspartate(D-aspartate) O-methyltransferase [Planctomycetota bacterium]
MARDFAEERERMIAAQIASRGINDRRLLAAMRKVPRHLFCRPPGHPEAYCDYPLSIGEGQTISQPYIVALMTDRLRLTGAERVLEIGTGSGYQTAILAELAAEVVSVERIDALAERARKTLQEQGYENVRVEVGDGTLGRPDGAPYDRVIVTAGSPEVPPSLMQQLGDGGIMVIPVGPRYLQSLTVVTRRGDKFDEQADCACTFVKLIGKEGWDGAD